MYVLNLYPSYRQLVITVVLDLFVYMYSDCGRRNILRLLLIENVDGHAFVDFVVVVVVEITECQVEC